MMGKVNSGRKSKAEPSSAAGFRVPIIRRTCLFAEFSNQLMATELDFLPGR